MHTHLALAIYLFKRHSYTFKRIIFLIVRLTRALDIYSVKSTVVVMTQLGIIAWGSFCTIVLYGVFKQLNLPKKLAGAMGLAMLSYVVPVFYFWGNSFAVNITYGVHFVIMLMSLVISCLFKSTRKTFAWFFLGVVILFFFFWISPGLLPYRLGWEERGEAKLERYLGGPFHHSTLAPAITSIILLFHCWHPSFRVFEWFSKHPCVYAFALGILIFAITSQIPEIFKYGTPWW